MERGQGHGDGYPRSDGRLYAEKAAYLDLEPREQNRRLQENLEDQFGAQVDQADLLNATDPRKPLAWKVVGRLDRAAGRHREVAPFPLTPCALDLPETLSEVRKDYIVLPYLLSRRAVCQFLVPPGYTWGGLAPFERSNAFGSVTFKAEWVAGAAGPVLKAVLTVTVTTALAPATAWGAFTDFISWIREASATHLLLERKP